MLDYFELLGQPRRPWIDPDVLKRTFLALSEKLHPDRLHETSADEKQCAHERYTELNSAYQCLLQPRDRLGHLLELEVGKRPGAIQSAPAAFMDLFLEIGDLCRDVDKFLKEKQAVTSALLRVSLFERAQELSEGIQTIQQKILTFLADHERALHSLNSAWEKAPPIGSPERLNALPLAQIEEHYRAFSYLTRWTAQLQERFVELAV